MLDNGIWTLEEAGKFHCFDVALAKAIAEQFEIPDCVADVGCGLGSYCKFFAQTGWRNVVGYEGTPGIAKIAFYDPIVELDLASPLATDGYPMSDIVLCLEVGEHIPARCEDIFIDNLTYLVLETLILSWAVPGQGGVGHVNERDNEYIIKKVEQRSSMCYDEKRSSALRAAATLPWFKNTIMVFEY